MPLMKNLEPNQVNFTKMLDRPNLSLSLNKSKFSEFDRDTLVHSKNKRLRSVSFDKTVSRMTFTLNYSTVDSTMRNSV
jgi:hypothetical protein